MAAAVVCATSNFRRIHRALTEGVIAGGPWNEGDICGLRRGRNNHWFARRDAGKRAAWRCCRRRGSGLLLWARLSRTTSRALRRFWQLGMGDTAFLGRLWLGG